MDLRNYSKIVTLDIVQSFGCASCTQCCSNKWNIDFTKDEFENTKQKLATLNLDINDYAYYDEKQNVYRTKFKDGFCAFLQKDKLCMLQKNFGWEILSRTCRCYPRRIFLSPLGLEISYIPTCPTVVELLFSDKSISIVQVDKEKFRFMPLDSYEFIYPENNNEKTLQFNFFEVREKMIEAFNDKKLSLKERISNANVILNNFDKLKNKSELEKLFKDFKENLNEEISINYINEILYLYHQNAPQEYANYRKLFLEFVGDKPGYFIGSGDSSFITDKFIEDVFKAGWDKSDDEFLVKYIQTEIFQNSIYTHGVNGFILILVSAFMLKLKLALHAAIAKRKLTKDEKIKLVVATVGSSHAHNTKLSKAFYDMFAGKEAKKQIQNLITTL